MSIFYITGAKIARIKYSVKGKYSFKKHIPKHGFSMKAIEKVNDFIKDFKITILRDYQGSNELIRVIKDYRLAPNDAQIVLTCKQSNIEALATFDEDFRRVP